ncbi:hypothetical protein GCM10009424_20910 [Sphingomonas ursincola]
MTHVFAVHDQICALIGSAPDKDMHMWVVGIPMIGADPVQAGTEIPGHVEDQLARENSQVCQLGGVLGRDDEPKMVAVIMAARGKRIAIGSVPIAIE